MIDEQARRKEQAEKAVVRRCTVWQPVTGCEPEPPGAPGTRHPCGVRSLGAAAPLTEKEAIMAETPSGSPTPSVEPENKPYAGGKLPPTGISLCSMPIAFIPSAMATVTSEFYLARLDPSIHGDGTNSFTPYAQIVMPERAFILILFFRQQVHRMVDAGTISQEELSQLRASFGLS